MAKLDEKQKAFLEQPFVGVVTTLREDGSPHNTVVWVDVDNGDGFVQHGDRAREAEAPRARSARRAR